MLLAKENIDINQIDQDKRTALMYASKEGHCEIVKMLEAKVKETQAKNNNEKIGNITKSKN